MIEMDEQMLLNHYNSIFDQKPEFSMKLGLKEAKKLKIYVYYPNSKHDFYKLVTSGCTFLYQDRNEYMMFLSKDTPVVKGTADKNLIFYPLFLLKASSKTSFDNSILYVSAKFLSRKDLPDSMWVNVMYFLLSAHFTS